MRTTHRYDVWRFLEVALLWIILIVFVCAMICGLVWMAVKYPAFTGGVCVGVLWLLIVGTAVGLCFRK